MAFQASSPSWLAATLALFSFFSLLLPANALYFYVEGRQPKCFFEDLPKDTLVAGKKRALHTQSPLRNQLTNIPYFRMNRQVRNTGHQPKLEQLLRGPEPKDAYHRRRDLRQRPPRRLQAREPLRPLHLLRRRRRPAPSLLHG